MSEHICLEMNCPMKSTAPPNKCPRCFPDTYTSNKTVEFISCPTCQGTGKVIDRSNHE